jgi:hypothetical protein
MNEELAKVEDQFKELQSMNKSGYNLQIVGYDGKEIDDSKPIMEYYLDELWVIGRSIILKGRSIILKGRSIILKGRSIILKGRSIDSINNTQFIINDELEIK